MRYSRQNKILDIINSHEVDTQEKLAEFLRQNGFDVTQATVSRDIKELQLLKTLSASGKYRYTVGTDLNKPTPDRFVKIIRETIQSVNSSGNIIVIKTLNGCANAAAETIDSMNIDDIIGTIAGDNTIFMVAGDSNKVPALVRMFNEMLV
jgi:transcriptional regulator of arginine metabolism